MAIIKEDDKKQQDGQDDGPAEPEPVVEQRSLALPSNDGDDSLAPPDSASGGEDDAVSAPAQLGTKRFVYAAYFAGAIGIAFLLTKAITFGWLKIAAWKPGFGEPREDLVMLVSAVLGALAAFYYWHRTRARKLAEEVASELSKVTWPSRTEVTNSTFVVIVTTLVATVFFALMDRFWGFVTNLVYGT